MLKTAGRRFVQAAILCYVSVAVFSTTFSLFRTALPALLSGGISQAFSLLYTKSRLEDDVGRQYYESGFFATLPVDERVLYWQSDFAVRNGLATPNRTMSERTFLSKAFSQTMKPGQILPFYYRATSEFAEEDITVTTLVTDNRFPVLARLVEQYAGPISVTVHIPSSPPNATAQRLAALHALYTSNPEMAARVDVHVMHDPFDRALNTWRNAARLLARTAYVMMLDVDFAVCTDFRRRVLRDGGTVRRLLKEGTAALVVPAFEYVDAAEGRRFEAFPKRKKDLLSLVRRKKIDMFHRSWPPGHNSTDYPRYYAAPHAEVYPVTQYQSAYEPYVIFKKDGPPWCDERFVGYGGNKAACLFEMYLSGVTFYVLSDDFIIHQSHPYEEAARRHERRYNRKIYADFREETCLKYLKRFADDGTLSSPRGQNVIAECRKLKGISKIAADMFIPEE